MIAACPKCHTRYRVGPEQLGADGARLRCSQCSAVFRVRLPQAAAPSPPRQDDRAEYPASNREAIARSEAKPSEVNRLATAQQPARSEAKASEVKSFATAQQSPAPPPPRQDDRSEHPASNREAIARSEPKASEVNRFATAQQSARSEPKASEVNRFATAQQSARSEPKASEVNRFATAQQSARSEPKPSEVESFATAQHSPRNEAPHFDRERLVVVANANPDSCKVLAEMLEGWGLQVLVAHDGVEAILTIQRTLPRAIVMDAALPKMFGFQVCELVKRNESLRSIHVVLVGAIHKEDRYRRAPNELYGADVYVEPHELPDKLEDILERFELPLARRGREAARSLPAPPPPRQADRLEYPAGGTEGAARSEPAPSPPRQSDRPEHRPAPAERARAASEASGVNSFATAQQPPRSEPKASEVKSLDPLEAERANAERLARIIVSDIVLYNPEKFAAALRSGSVVAAMRDELEEGRALFCERIGAAVRGERDHLADELLRVAQAREGR